MKTKTRPTTIVDVARVAGVSPKTVSRVVTGRGYVSGETLSRVQSAIAELDYRVNRAAQTLVSDRSTTIGLVVPSVSNPFFPEVFASIQETALEQNYTVSVFETSSRADLESRAISVLDEHRAAGLIVYIPHLPDDELRGLLERHHAAVLIGHNTLRDLAGIVRVDVYDATRQAVDHLVQGGRRRLAYIDVLNATKHVDSERRRGWRDGLEANGIPFVQDHVVACEDSMAGAQRVTERLLNQHPDIDGIICHHDILAYGALEACDRMGIAIPGRVAVVGYDDISYSGLERISLTTLRFPKAEIGKQAANMLIQRIEGETEPMEVLLKTELVVRGTTPGKQ